MQKVEMLLKHMLNLATTESERLLVLWMHEEGEKGEWGGLQLPWIIRRAALDDLWGPQARLEATMPYREAALSLVETEQSSSQSVQVGL